MRLTLRTLLGWKDGTLPPEEYGFIGSRVAQGKVASGLAERIGAVLATPPAALPGENLALYTDHLNGAAEYLDNVLPSEELAEFERACIGSVQRECLQRLEEVAACHAILADAFHDRVATRYLPSARRRRLIARLGLAGQSSPQGSAGATTPDTIVAEGSDTTAPVIAAAGVPPVQPTGTPAPAAEAQSSQDAARRLLEEFSRARMTPTPPQAIETAQRSRVPEVGSGGLLGGLSMTAVASAAVAAGSAVMLPSSTATSPSPTTSRTAVKPSFSVDHGQWVKLLTVAVALAAILSFGGVLAASLQGPRAYTPEPGCLNCTEP